jgi:hypothetical protein
MKAGTLKSWAAGRGRREITKRAAEDLQRGLKDTDCRGVDKPAQADCPRPARKRRRK